MTLLAERSRYLPREETTGNTVYLYPPRRKFEGSQPRAIYENFRTPLDETIDDIRALLTWPEEWDGYQVAPSGDAVSRAQSWIKSLYEEVEDAPTGSREWIAPLVVADAHRNVVFEWWEGQKKLTVYVTPIGVEYVKVWGPDIFSEMDDGDIKGAEDRRTLWRWLVG
jgi:hypothetical protein